MKVKARAKAKPFAPRPLGPALSAPPPAPAVRSRRALAVLSVTAASAAARPEAATSFVAALLRAATKAF